MCFLFLLGPAPFFVASLFCFEAKRKSGWGICGSFLVVVVLLFFVCLWFRDDLPKFLDHTCPCTLLLFIAYAIVRTEPSATSAKPEEKKKHLPSPTPPDSPFLRALGTSAALKALPQTDTLAQRVLEEWHFV